MVFLTYKVLEREDAKTAWEAVVARYSGIAPMPITGDTRCRFHSRNEQQPHGYPERSSTLRCICFARVATGSLRFKVHFTMCYRCVLNVFYKFGDTGKRCVNMAQVHRQ